MRLFTCCREKTNEILSDVKHATLLTESQQINLPELVSLWNNKLISI